MTEYFGLGGQVALVTGASSGLGQHFARVLAKAGCRVGIAARRKDRLEALADDIERKGGRAIPLVMDVTDRDAIVAGFAKLEKAVGVPTVVVNNAGFGGAAPLLDETPDTTQRIFAVNQMAVWTVAQVAAGRMVANATSGSIINISSITGLRTANAISSYAVSKAAVAHMTKQHALELARHGIRVNAIAPGYFESEMTHDFLASEAGAALPRRIPMRRTGRHGELDGVLLLLASDKSSYMTGAVIPVDGGHLVSGL